MRRNDLKDAPTVPGDDLNNVDLITVRDKLLPTSIVQPLVTAIEPIFGRVVRKEPGAGRSHVDLVLAIGRHPSLIVVPVRLAICTWPRSVPTKETVEYRVILDVIGFNEESGHKVNLNNNMSTTSTSGMSMHHNVLGMLRCVPHLPSRR